MRWRKATMQRRYFGYACHKSCSVGLAFHVCIVWACSAIRALNIWDKSNIVWAWHRQPAVLMEWIVNTWAVFVALCMFCYIRVHIQMGYAWWLHRALCVCVWFKAYYTGNWYMVETQYVFWFEGWCTWYHRIVEQFVFAVGLLFVVVNRICFYVMRP